MRSEIEVTWQHDETGYVFTKRIPEGEPIPIFPRRTVIDIRPADSVGPDERDSDHTERGGLPEVTGSNVVTECGNASA